jgi:hypothetical protein
MALRLVECLAIILTALALVPSGAHLAAIMDVMSILYVEEIGDARLINGSSGSG